MQFWAILKDSFRESLDRKIFWVIVLLTLAVSAGMFCIRFHAGGIELLFGYWNIDDFGYDPAEPAGRDMIVSIVVGIMGLFLGWVGVLLMIIATASFFPTMMRRGAIDVVLAKPISRTRLFLYKYVASMVFVLLQAALFVGLTFLVVGLRWKVWLPGYLLAIPLLVLLFSYLYCMSVLVGVYTRSVIAAILLSVGAWVAFTIPRMALDGIEVVRAQGRVAPAATRSAPSSEPALLRALRVATWIPPKTADVERMAVRFARGHDDTRVTADMMLPPNATRQDRRMMEENLEIEREREMVSPLYSIGSSLLFEAVVVALALRRFARRDF
jgi:ABC-type transport system involved in multi-copper enzyme maturation permease subunit